MRGSGFFLGGVLAAIVTTTYISPASAAPRLIKIGHADAPGQVTFTNVVRPDATQTILNASNPVILGNNLYAPDLLRVGDQWYCYHGGWLTDTQLSDCIYLGISTSMDLSGPWVPASQQIISQGTYMHLNDPSVVIDNGTWYMVYTAFKVVGSQARDWINYSTSTDGVHWNPSAGTVSTEISITDPNNVAGGTITDMARPSLVRAPTRWEMWFDATVDNSAMDSYLAYCTAATPTQFTLVHKYPKVSSFPGFYEPDVVRRPDGTYLAVIQRYFSILYKGTSTDGINFTLDDDISTSTPFFGRKSISNPGLAYDQINDQLMGLGFGMTDSPTLVGHDIGFSVTQYHIYIRTGGSTWLATSVATARDRQSVKTSTYTSFDRVRVVDSATGATMCEQDFTTAAPGDIWHVQWDPNELIIASVPTDSARIRMPYTRQMELLAGTLPVTWSLAQAPAGASIDAQGLVAGWTPPRAAYGQTFHFEAKAANTAGPASVAWDVQVTRGLPDFDGDGDVDQVDFSYLQLCLTDSGVAPTDACKEIDNDYDNDVDNGDVAAFIRCMSGPGVQASVSCLD